MSYRAYCRTCEKGLPGLNRVEELLGVDYEHFEAIVRS